LEHNQTSKAPRPCPVVETRNAVQQEVTKLSKETKEIDGLIKEVEIKAARESNEANVVELLDEPRNRSCSASASSSPRQDRKTEAGSFLPASGNDQLRFIE